MCWVAELCREQGGLAAGPIQPARALSKPQVLALVAPQSVDAFRQPVEQALRCSALCFDCALLLLLRCPRARGVAAHGCREAAIALPAPPHRFPPSPPLPLAPRSSSQDEDRPATAAAAEVLAGLLSVPATYATGGAWSAWLSPALKQALAAAPLGAPFWARLSPAGLLLGRAPSAGAHAAMRFLRTHTPAFKSGRDSLPSPLLPRRERGPLAVLHAALRRAPPGGCRAGGRHQGRYHTPPAGAAAALGPAAAAGPAGGAAAGGCALYLSCACRAVLPRCALLCFGRPRLQLFPFLQFAHTSTVHAPQPSITCPFPNPVGYPVGCRRHVSPGLQAPVGAATGGCRGGHRHRHRAPAAAAAPPAGAPAAGAALVCGAAWGERQVRVAGLWGSAGPAPLAKSQPKLEVCSQCPFEPASCCSSPLPMSHPPACLPCRLAAAQLSAFVPCSILEALPAPPAEGANGAGSNGAGTSDAEMVVVEAPPPLGAGGGSSASLEAVPAGAWGGDGMGLLWLAGVFLCMWVALRSWHACQLRRPPTSTAPTPRCPTPSLLPSPLPPC